MNRHAWGDRLVPGPWRDWVILKPWLFWFENELYCRVCELRYGPRSRRRAAAWLRVHRHCGLLGSGSMKQKKRSKKA